MVDSDDPANAAPGGLELVRRFVDTEDIYNSRDLLADGETAAAWLLEQGVPAAGPVVGRRDLAILRALRDTMREMATAHTLGEAEPVESVAGFNRLVSRYPALVYLSPVSAGGGVEASLVPTREGVGAVVGEMAAAVHRAVITGDWVRLKACASAECQWLFYDESRNRTARWCTMRGCGSISKARRYRQRQRRPTAPPDSRFE